MSSPRTLLIEYRYDPLDRLVTCAPANLPSHQRFYRKDRLATEIHGAIAHSIFQQEDRLLAQQQRQGTTTETSLLATDQSHSVLHVVDKAQRHSITYSPYGHHAPTNGLLSLLEFNGERADPVTRHYLLGNGYRAFNPVLMRFNSPDSWSPFGDGGVNAYGYSVAPPNFTDPSGHFLISLIKNIWSLFNKLDLALRGAHFKPIRNLRVLREQLTFFEDTYKGATRANLAVHGKQAVPTQYYAVVNGRMQTPSELYKIAKAEGVKLKEYESVRLIMCGGASQPNNSQLPYAGRLAEKIGRPVKAFEGVISSAAPEHLTPDMKRGIVYQPSTDFHILKNSVASTHFPQFFSEKYRPKTFGIRRQP